MSANHISSTGALARLENINRELGEINALISREIPHLHKRPELVDRLIVRCEAMLCELLEIRAANETAASPANSWTGGMIGSNENGSASPI